jgi:hypothetical protein
VPKRVSEGHPGPNPKEQRSSQATRKKRQRPSQSTRKKRAQHGGEGEPRAHLLPKALTAQGTSTSEHDQAMLTQMALAEELLKRGPHESPEQLRERAERLRKHVADLKADTERRVAEELGGIVARLSPWSRGMLADLTRRRQLDGSQQRRWAGALLETEGLEQEPRIVALVGLVTDDEQERTEMLLRLAGRYNRGRPKDDLRWARAKEAWLAAHMRERAHQAVPDAMKASGFGKSAVYERARREDWSAALSR